MSQSVSRRGVLLAGVAGAAGSAGLILPGSPALAHEPLISRNYLNSSGCHLYYGGSRSSFDFNPTFYDQMSAWKEWVNDNVVDSWGYMRRVHSNGVHVNKGSDSLHTYGRAMDLSKVRFQTTSGTLTKRFELNKNVWEGTENAATWRRRYWGFAASLLRRFSWALTYAYNAEHKNHIHVDNDLYGWVGSSHFTGGASTQTLIVQACCRYIWGKGTAIDGAYGSQARTHSTEVLRRIGVGSGRIDNSAGAFHAFCAASFRKSVGKQNY